MLYKLTFALALISLVYMGCSNREHERDRLEESPSSTQNMQAESNAAMTDSTTQGGSASGTYNTPSKQQNQNGNRTNYSSDKAVESQNKK